MNESEKKEKLEKAIKLLLELSHDVKVIKHVPGSIKLRISFLGLRSLLRSMKEFTSTDVQAAKEVLPGLGRIQILPISRSAVITYDDSLIPYELWQGLFGPKETRDPEAVIERRLRELVSA